MSEWIKSRRRRVALSACGLLATAAVASASLAVAQSDTQPDRSTDAAAAAGLVTTSCGAQLSSTVRTESVGTVTSPTTFADLAGATTTVTVPAGTTRCIKVVFTAETVCAIDACRVQALDNGVAMNPQGGGKQAIDSEHAGASGHGFEWVRRVGPGLHVIKIQQRVENAATQFAIDDWTFDVQTHA